MTIPTDIGVIDTMFDLPYANRNWASHLGNRLLDEESRKQSFVHPAGFLFKEPPQVERSADTIGDTLREMDRYGIDKALISVSDDVTIEAITRHRDRFLGQVMIDPSVGMPEIGRLVEMRERHGVVAASFFPCGCDVAINDKRAYPLYAKCVELGLPIFVNAGVPGPRMPFAPQHVELIDEVCWFFPDLKFVMRHGAEPWVDLAVKLLLKWPNLYYSTSAFAPKFFPKAIIDYANTRGSDKIIYAGYYPSGLSLERSFSELPAVPLRDEVWPKFLRNNA